MEGDRFTCMDFEVVVPDAAPMYGAAWLGIRPHDLMLASAERAQLHAEVELTEPLGATLLVHARSRYCVTFRMLVPADARVQRGDQIGVEFRADRLHVFDRDTGKRQARRRT